jgi:16S rRNA (guanine527-N7)-methyltransferase
MLPEGGESPPEVFEALLALRCSVLGLVLDPVTSEKLARYLAVLDLWRRRTNLTGPLSAQELVEHALESAFAVDWIAPGASLADVGSGAGFPGIPIAILRRDVSIVPVEPRKKRREFLDHVSQILGLANVAAAAPGLSGLPAARLSGAVSRAVGRLAEIVGEGEFLEPRGVLLAWTTEPEALARDLGLRFHLESVREVPGSRKKRIALFRKASEAPGKQGKRGLATGVPRGTVGGSVRDCRLAVGSRRSSLASLPRIVLSEALSRPPVRGANARSYISDSGSQPAMNEPFSTPPRKLERNELELYEGAPR